MQYNEMEDLKLVSLVKEHADNEAMVEICRRYENIFYKICQKFSPVLTNVGICVSDIFDEKYYIIFNCVTSFDETKNTKLSTHIGNYARYLCLNAINSKKFTISSSDENIKTIIEKKQSEVTYKKHDNDDNYFIFNILSQLKDNRIIEVFKKRYFYYNSNNKKIIWSKIAKDLKISTQTAINLHNKGVKILKKKFKSCDFADII